MPCHPHRKVASFDFTSIEEQIRIIRAKKEAAKQATRRIKKIEKNRD